MKFEPVRFRHIGRGGTSEDVTVEEIIDDAIQELAHKVQADDRADKASIGVTVNVENVGENAVVISAKVAIKEPAKKVKAISANIGRHGQAVTMEHKQQALSFDEGEDTPIKMVPTH